MTTIDPKQKLILTTEIQDKIADASLTFDSQIKGYFKYQSKYIREYLSANSKLNSYQFKSLVNKILTFWNESINPDTEVFWGELKINNIDFERKDPLKFALTKNRFRTVEQGIGARNFWTELKKLSSIKDKYSQAEINKIDSIIIQDENRRLDVLKKCLIKKSIPQGQYLKFGECMAYFANCKLFGKYFTSGQIEELYDIWKNFKSK
ncbi:hypothetical protein BH10BAC2_BH10BAC2_11550 [soil metagenome]